MLKRIPTTLSLLPRLAALAIALSWCGGNLPVAIGSECWQQPVSEISGGAGVPTGDSDVLTERPPRKSDAAHDQQVQQRLIRVAILVICLLCLLAVLFGYLRMDHATRGFYSGRLQTLALIAAAVVLIFAYLAWTVWLRQP